MKFSTPSNIHSRCFGFASQTDTLSDGAQHEWCITIPKGTSTGCRIFGGRTVIRKRETVQTDTQEEAGTSQVRGGRENS